MTYSVAKSDRLYAEMKQELLRLAPHASLNQKLTYCLWCSRSLADTLGDEISFAIGSDGKKFIDDVNRAIQGYLFHQEANTREKLEEYSENFDSLDAKSYDDKAGYELFLCISAIEAVNCASTLMGMFLDGKNGFTLNCAAFVAMVVETDVDCLEDPSVEEKLIQFYALEKEIARLMLQNDITEEQFEDSVLVITRGVELHDDTQLRLGVRG